MTGDPAGPDIGADGLAELVLHYAHALAEGREFVRQLTEAGVPGAAIRVEDQSKDT